jgi:uncharacterized protein (DUF58 family)
MADALNPPHKSPRGAHERTAAETAARAFPALLVEAERLAATIIAGDHGRRQSGAGETFWQFRHFRQGDPRSAVDWRRSAKSDAYYVRETEWELAQAVWMWCDRSVSMDYCSHLAQEPKAFRAAVLTLALGLLLTRAGERVGDIAQDARARSGEAALRGLTMTVTAPPQGTSPLPQIDERLRRSNLVLVSDLLRPAEDIVSFINEAAAQGTHGHIVQVFDPAEESWPFEGRILFEDTGAGHHLLAGRAESLRATYREKLEAHRDAIGDAARRAGWSFIVHHTDAAPQSALLALYARLAGDADIGPTKGLSA